MARHIHARVYLKVFQKYNHEAPPRPQHSPYVIAPKKYGKDAHDQIPPDESPPVSKENTNRIQGVPGSILFHARSVDFTFLVYLNSIAIQQTITTYINLKRTEYLLDYVATHPDAKIRYRASEMILQIHTDASYLSEPKARSRSAGHYFWDGFHRTTKPYY